MNEINYLMEEIPKYQYDNIEMMYQKCLDLKELAIINNDNYALCFAYNYMTDYYYSCREHDEAMELANQTLTLNEQYGYKDLLMQIYNLYAIVVCNNDYSLAMGYYLKGLTLAKKMNDIVSLAKFNCNIGDVFLNLDEYDLALPYFIKSYEYINMIDKNDNFYKGKRFIVLYIAMIYCKKNMDKEALDILSENRVLFDDGLIDSMNQLARSVYTMILFKQNKIEQCLKHMDIVLNNDILGFRSSEVNYLTHKMLYTIAIELKDLKRVELIFNRFEENKFYNSSNRYQLELIESKIEACHVFNILERLPLLYQEHYQLSLIKRKENTDFCLSSVLYKMELYKEYQEKEEIIKLTKTDELTGLNNRRVFDEKFIKYGYKTKYIGVIMFDIDNFKLHNDTLGHLMGDNLLKSFAKILNQHNKKILPCRYGGDEFICLCLDCNEHEIIKYIEQVYSEFEQHQITTTSISCGYYNMKSKKGMTSDQLIKKADDYLYHVKRNGRNGYYGCCQ